eukprot:TRINITY_DN11492_c6_g2_i1.p1 TRINITY_DN11492_c6_g2~~TRINITY_DN11492_c6_g2_i1.p1  ORF type:complete len:803 (+),score=167.38 TRINITY_DN11492_c6_g2_i1:67-2475(+)
MPSGSGFFGCFGRRSRRNNSAADPRTTNAPARRARQSSARPNRSHRRHNSDPTHDGSSRSSDDNHNDVFVNALFTALERALNPQRPEGEPSQRDDDRLDDSRFGAYQEPPAMDTAERGEADILLESARATLHRHASRLSSQRPSDSSASSSTVNTLPRRVVPTSALAAGAQNADGTTNTLESIRHPFPNGQAELDVVVQPDGSTTLRLAGPDADHLQAELSGLVPPTAAEGRTSASGPRLRRLDSIVRGQRQNSMEDFFRDFHELLALAYIDDVEKKATQHDLDRLVARRDSLASQLLLQSAEFDYDQYRRSIHPSAAGTTDVLHRLKQLEEQLSRLRLLWQVATTTLEILELPPVEASVRQLERLNEQRLELVDRMDNLKAGSRSMRHSVAQEKELAQSRPETSREAAEDSRRQLTADIAQAEQQVACQKFRLRYMGKRAHGKLELTLRSEAILADTKVALAELPVGEWRKRLMIKFKAQEGQDFGGISREWMEKVARGATATALASGSLTFANEHHTHLVLQPSQCHSAEALASMELLGRVVGLAMFHGLIAPLPLDTSIYKLLRGQKLTLGDLKDQDAVLGRSMQQVLDMDGVEALDLCFQAEMAIQGQTVTCDLARNGGDRAVTDANKHAYVQAQVDFRYGWGVAPLLEKMVEGITGFIAMSDLQRLPDVSIRLLLCGQTKVDVVEWKKNAVYSDGYTQDSPPVQWFWSFVAAADDLTCAKLLKFITGASAVPLGGFGGLKGLHGRNPFVIARVAEPRSFPVAHTCVNRLDLPEYATEQETHSKLAYAIAETDGFQIV